MDEIEAFLDECRADPWFQSHPEVVDPLESVAPIHGFKTTPKWSTRSKAC
jgi:hypothetical protein